MKNFLITLLLLTNFSLFAQKTGSIVGTVADKNTQAPLLQAIVTVEKLDISAKTSETGKFELNSVPVGSVNVTVTIPGYKPETQFNIIVETGAMQYISFELEKITSIGGDVVVKGKRKQSAAAADLITPLSVQRLTATEIRSNPGGNFDISKVIQALPGVAGNTAGGGFRNDIIIRGGAPNENVFYLDGIEIPVLNHFQTQGSAGGPAGILNVSFIEDVKLSSSAFDARYDNALASVFQFKQREGNAKKFGGNFRLSGTESAATFEGPINKNTTFLLSARKSYLQFLFKILDLPISPRYWDFQYKVTSKLNSKTTLNLIGLGAIDNFTTITPTKSDANKEFLLRRTPYIDQWNYTMGASIKRLVKDGFYNVAISRNMFDNSFDQFENKQIGNEAFRTFKLRSQEIENKLRFDYNRFSNGWKWSAGASIQYAKFNNNLLNKFKIIARDSLGKPITDSTGNAITVPLTVAYKTAVDLFKFGLFGQVSKRFLQDKLGVTFGVRSDMNSFTTEGSNPLKAISPRASISYALAPKWQASASVGMYNKLPIYTALGYKTANGYENKDLKYLRSTHYVVGLEYLPKNDLRLTAEMFHKQYNNYMVSKTSGISIANQGADFEAIGNEAFTSTGKGQATGFEVFLQKKLTKTFFATASYTYVRSKFSGANGKLLPSAWDNVHLFSGIFGKKFARNWEFGAKIRVTGGSPYTPYDTVASRGQFVTNGRGVFDYNKLNSLRLTPFSQFDFRIDKKYNFKKTTLDLFFDIQNAFLTKSAAIPTFVLERNASNTDFITTDSKPINANGTNGVPLVGDFGNAIPTPTIGFIFEF